VPNETKLLARLDFAELLVPPPFRRIKLELIMNEFTNSHESNGPFIECKYCHRNVTMELLDRHKAECSNEMPLNAKIDEADDSEIRRLLKDFCRKRPFFSDMADDRLEADSDDDSNSDIGLAPWEE